MNREKEQVDKGWERMKELLEAELPPSSTPVLRFGWWSTLATLVVVLGSVIPHSRVVDFKVPVVSRAATPANDGFTSDMLGGFSTPLKALIPSNATGDLPRRIYQNRIVGQPVAVQREAVEVVPQLEEISSLPRLPKLVSMFQGLPGRSLMLHLAPVPAPARMVQPVSPHRNNPGWQLRASILLGANFFQVKQMPGVLGGLSLDISPRKRRWGVQTGLLYRSQVFAGESRPVIPVTYQSFQSATGHTDQDLVNMPNASLLINAANRMLVPVIKSHQLEAPLLLYYAPFSKFRLYAGATFMRHIWIESADRSLFTYDLRVVQNPADAPAGSLSSELINQLPAWERNWQLGLSYTFFKRMEAGIFYRSTMRHSPALADVAQLFDKCYNCSVKYPEAEVRTQQSLRPQAVQLNLRYQF